MFVYVFAVQSLQSMYTSMNSPSQLTGWKSSGGDPCLEAWKGITCQGSSVVAMSVSLLFHLFSCVLLFARLLMFYLTVGFPDWG